MEKIIIDIENCTKCSHHKITDTYSSDGWDRMDTWFCSKENKKIASAVEWHDKIKIPDWCPIKIDGKILDSFPEMIPLLNILVHKYEKEKNEHLEMENFPKNFKDWFELNYL